MGRKRVTPEIIESELGANPFLSGLEIAVTKKINKVINKFGEEDIREFDLEATPYTKLFQVKDARVQVSDLPLRSKELYLHILHTIKPTKDYIWIDRVSYMGEMRIKALNTFKDAIKELALGGYVSRHESVPDLLWINPHFFFKGSRINKFKSNLKHKEVK